MTNIQMMLNHFKEKYHDVSDVLPNPAIHMVQTRVKLRCKQGIPVGLEQGDRPGSRWIWLILNFIPVGNYVP
jgi:hypothetical protein